jgi:undecaprenyl-diphosphatase
MTLLHAILLGLVQGLGEFLPISSSAHLILVPWLFNFPDPGLSFDVALHFGTLIAIVLYFWKDWLDIMVITLSSSPFGRGFSPKFFLKFGQTGEGQTLRYTKYTFWLVVLATIPGALFGYLLENKAEAAFRNPLLIAFSLVILGALLYLADKHTQEKKNLQNLTLRDSVLIGCSQALAIIPGVSRAGSTITTGLALGLSRESAARFSFLMSAPIIFGASLVKFKYLLSAGSAEIVAIIVAAISGYFAIAWMLKFIEKVSYRVFFWYRLALAIVIVAIYFVR